MSQRLDVALVSRGLAPSRSQAQTLVRSGLVLVDGHVTTRPSHPVDGQRITLEGTGSGGDAEWIRRGWVGRGALKLEHALRTFGVDAGSRRCLDVGASTGGFTQVLLEHGARSVISLDVGQGQLDPMLARDPRVTDLQGVSVRDVAAADLGGPVELLVGDLSFISLQLVLPVLTELTQPGADLVLLVKPQFEVGRTALGKGGVVRSGAARHQVLVDLDLRARGCGLCPQGLERSPVRGGHGNVEYLWWLRRGVHPRPGEDRPDGMMGCGPAPDVLAARARALTQEEDR